MLINHTLGMYDSSPLLPTHSRCGGCLLALDHNQLHKPQSVGFLWARDRPVAEASI
jgi:hypothetical protein